MRITYWNHRFDCHGGWSWCFDRNDKESVWWSDLSYQ